MSRDSSHSEGNATSDRQWFTTTHWSVVLSTGQGDSSQVSAALDKLCRTYWPPICGYIRNQGYSLDDAKDLTQAFFAKLLQKNFWARADPQKGRFRSFLLTACRQFLADERDRLKAAKRGGGVPLISLDEQSGEEHFALDQNLTPEQQFDRQWADTVLEEARERLRVECVAGGKSELYERVKLFNDDQERSATYAQIAAELGMSVSAIKSAVLRLRARYAELVREEVARTVSCPAELDAEIAYLLSIIGS